jgi:WD40 repeat protein
LSTIPGATIANFSPDGNSIVTNAGLFAVGYDTGAEVVDGTISAFTSDIQLLATYQDGYVNLWNVNNPSHITFPLAQYTIKGVKELAFSPDNHYLYIVRAGDVQMWGVK